MAVEKNSVAISETEYSMNENDVDTSEENERPSGERWAPLGANDCDDDFNDYKCSTSTEAISYNMDRLKMLEDEQEVLNSSLIALTTHFAQVQFRLRQIVDAATEEKDGLLKELEEFAFRGIPDVPNNVSFSHKSSTSLLSEIQCENYSGLLTDMEVESKISMHKSKQKELINQLKLQLEDLEQYAYETDGQELPQSVILERQTIIINHLKEKLNFEIDDLCKLPIDDLRWQVDHAINEIVNPLKMKEQLVNQLKTQVCDLERFIHYLQSEISTETLACSCACPIHPNGKGFSSDNTKKSYLQHQTEGGNDHTKTIHTVRKVIALLHIYLMSQLSCGTKRIRRDIKKNSEIFAWRELRIQLDIAIEGVLKSAMNSCDDNNKIYESNSGLWKVYSNTELIVATRKHLALSIRDLMQHGLTSDLRGINSVVPFIGCFPHKKILADNSMHAWELVLKYYEIKNGHMYNSTPTQRLSQSFNLNLERSISAKQSLLTTIGDIITTHTPYKRSYNAHFKAFISAALNSNKLVIWLKLILQCQYLLENHYTSWSYVVKTGFQDAFHSLDRLTHVHFNLPVDLAVRQFQNIKDAF
ncbi:hypothetical protein PV327_010051 [Microctonus hyperodae]|uniref:RUN domain-containing protein n=1 Tax=Microctonus hyperodae TaxID=165561 RepID=A0AA39F298_MICHY|nr:hypothetical protein PV327_010051 [Microctonus hyperodae]